MNSIDNNSTNGLCKINRRVITATPSNCEPEVDWVIEEQAIALVFNQISHAVMMATPRDLLDFAIGFSLSEGIINQAKDILTYEIVEAEQGIEVQLGISSRQFSALKHKRRSLLGNSGCGLCGVESLAQTVKTRAKLEPITLLSFDVVNQAVTTFTQQQQLNQLTGSAHAAAFCAVDTGEILCIREDVGRHNALDKLLGALAQQPAYNTELQRQQGFILVSSRASYEMVDKTIAAGIHHLVSISAATSKAIQWAQQHQLNLIGFARSNRHLRYSQPHK
ncbi:formate dehydrogenase accessory sulfurtransferase FdhD [Colwellia sp. KU-HH00111]|uniref:formate dehydrogenase accessory sulfurtransferase FdhD n=1 Tax=Colwellia sp. KU-HH00111 TaxID=3127652 RepID=UPI003104AE07